MQELKERIQKEGKVLPGNIVKVDGFLNHRVDCQLMGRMADEFARIFDISKVDLILTAEASGKITGLTLMPGDSVTSGQKLCTITGDSVDNQITNAKNSLANAKDSVESAQNRLDDYKITSPITGTVVEKTVKTGDNVGTSSNSNNTLCIIYDLSYLQMTLNIDELDIDNVEVGQTVNITSDAKEGQTFTGVVTKVSVVGTTSSGTTTYPVTVRIDETDGLRPGMNANAEIVVAEAANALTVPNAAIVRGARGALTKIGLLDGEH